MDQNDSILFLEASSYLKLKWKIISEFITSTIYIVGTFEALDSEDLKFLEVL
jgi:hypothetical protein